MAWRRPYGCKLCGGRGFAVTKRKGRYRIKGEKVVTTERTVFRSVRARGYVSQDNVADPDHPWVPRHRRNVFYKGDRGHVTVEAVERTWGRPSVRVYYPEVEVRRSFRSRYRAAGISLKRYKAFCPVCNPRKPQEATQEPQRVRTVPPPRAEVEARRKERARLHKERQRRR